PSIKDAGGRQLGVVHLLNGFSRNLFRWIAVIRGKRIQDILVPHPVLQHLRRGLNEVAGNVGAGESGVMRAGGQRVQHMSELMEQGFHITVSHERRLVARCRREVTQKSYGRALILAVRQNLSSNYFKLRKM